MAWAPFGPGDTLKDTAWPGVTFASSMLVLCKETSSQHLSQHLSLLSLLFCSSALLSVLCVKMSLP